jgi:hypothetical protein
VLPRLEFEHTPPAWRYSSPLAGQSHLTCYDYGGQTPPVCTWSGLYEEFIVIFHSWLIPERMSLNDIEHIVRAIDARMAQYLGTPVEGTGG